MKKKMGITIKEASSLRRHYPDQVCGYFLSFFAFGDQHPGD